MNNFYQIFKEEKTLLKKLGYILFERGNNVYLYHIKTGTLKKLDNDYFIQIRDFALFYSDEKNIVKSFSIENSNVDLLYRNSDSNKTMDATIHLTMDCSIELSLSENRVSLDFYNGNAFQFADLKIDPIKKEYDFYYEDNMKKAVIFYGRKDIYYCSSWSNLDPINTFFENELSFLSAILEVLSSSTVQDYFETLIPIIERYIPGISSIMKEYPILNTQKHILEKSESSGIVKKKYILKNRTKRN